MEVTPKLGLRKPSEDDYFSLTEHFNYNMEKTEQHNHAGVYSPSNHNHDGVYAPGSHKHTKSEISDFPTSMPASDVSAWAKQPTKPSYNASEVGALPVNGKAQSAGVADSATNATNAAQADKIDGYHVAVLPQATYDAGVKDPTTIYFTY